MRPKTQTCDRIQPVNKSHLLLASTLLRSARLHRCPSLRFRNPVHQLDVFLQQQSLGEGAFGVRTVPEGRCRTVFNNTSSYKATPELGDFKFIFYLDL